MDAEWISEADAAKRLGVERKRLRAARAAAPDQVQHQEGGAWVWLASGLAAVAEKMGLTLPPASEKNAPPPAEETLTVVSSPGPQGSHFPNPLVIQARRASGERVYVRVRESRKYLPRLRDGRPMTFAARRSEAGNWWVPAGREPRWPGMW